MTRFVKSSVFILIMLAVYPLSARAENCTPGKMAISPSVFQLGKTWRTCSGFTFAFQNDGDLVVYDYKQRPMWSSGTANKGAAELAFQADGNLVIYAEKPLWQSGTSGHPGSHLAIQGVGNIVIYGKNGPLWASSSVSAALLPPAARPAGCIPVKLTIFPKSFPPGTLWQTCSGNLVAFQNDGNFVIYNDKHKAIWSTGTANMGATRLSFQADGNLVIYAQIPLWQSGTSGHPGSQLALQDDGNIVIYGKSGPLWNTKTSIYAKAFFGSPGDKEYCNTSIYIFRDGYWREFTQFSNGTRECISDVCGVNDADPFI